MQTDIKQQLVDFITTYTDANGFAPTQRDMQQGCGLSSTSHVAYYVDMLIAEGRVTRIPRSPRTIRVVEG